jgi:anti-anti-sigma factor
MQLSERRVNDVSIIDVSGNPPEGAADLRERVSALLQRGERRIVLNVANLQHVNSSRFGEIVASYKVAVSQGGMLNLANVGPHLRSILHTTTLDKILESYETEEEAIASFGKTPASAPTSAA